MRRYRWKRLINALLKHVAGALLAATASVAMAAEPREGKDYLVLDPPRSTEGGTRVEVIEFFNYGCPVCYEAEPLLARWLQGAGAGVTLRRIPASTDENESFALTYYALEAMNEVARLHWPVYDNHHFDGKRLDEEPNLLAWLARNGVDAERFRSVRNSPENRARVVAARAQFTAYGVSGVPTFIVAGNYVTSARLAGGVKEMMDVVNYLVGRARAERRVR